MVTLTILVILSQIPVGQSGDDSRAVLQEINDSFDDYFRKSIDLQCLSTVKSTRDDKLEIHQRVLHYYGKGTVVSVTQSVTDDPSKKGRPRLTLVRSRNAQLERFLLIYAKDAANFPLLNSSALRSKNEWLLQEETLLDDKIDLSAYCASNFFGGIYDSYRCVPGMSYSAIRFLNQGDIQIDKVKKTKQELIIYYSKLPTQINGNIIKNGIITFSNINHWVVSKATVYFDGFVLNRDSHKWTASHDDCKIVYRVLDGLEIPSSCERELVAYDEKNARHVIKTSVTYEVSKMEDEAPFSLAFYGIPERTLQCPTPAAETELQGTFQPLPTLWNQMPLWGWLTALAIVFFVTGILVQTTRRRPLAK